MSRTGTEVVLLTPPGRGAVATIQVAGPNASPIVAAQFLPASKRPLEDQPVDRILFGRWEGPTGEEIIVCRRTPDVLEIHCHGGTSAARRIIGHLVAAGCQRVSWQQWLSSQGADPLKAAAQVALAHAATERAAAVLLDQCDGALTRAVSDARSYVAAGEREKAAARLTEILRWSDLGCHLTHPWRVVLAGRPNAGKSSLINALVGYGRSITDQRPGTTRDVVTAVTAIDGWPVEFADTAGLRRGEDLVEQAGVEQAQVELQSADLAVLVFDRSQPFGKADNRLVETWPAAVRVLNKCDLDDTVDSVWPAGLLTSAITGEGIDRLIARISERLVPEPPAVGTAVPFAARHVELLELALEAITNEDDQRVTAVLRDLAETQQATVSC